MYYSVYMHVHVLSVQAIFNWLGSVVAVVQPPAPHSLLIQDRISIEHWKVELHNVNTSNRGYVGSGET